MYLSLWEKGIIKDVEAGGDVGGSDAHSSYVEWEGIGHPALITGQTESWSKLVVGCSGYCVHVRVSLIGNVGGVILGGHECRGGYYLACIMEGVPQRTELIGFQTTIWLLETMRQEKKRRKKIRSWYDVWFFIGLLNLRLIDLILYYIKIINKFNLPRRFRVCSYGGGTFTCLITKAPHLSSSLSCRIWGGFLGRFGLLIEIHLRNRLLGLIFTSYWYFFCFFNVFHPI